MALWPDIATWVGPTTARSAGAMANPPRGLVLHIASGFYEGTISWQRRSSGDNRTSSHFIVARDGRCAQMVDTADGSWAQKSGNNTWLSIELEGFAPDDGLHATHSGWETATGAQLEVCARLLAKAHVVYGVPLKLATSPDGRGLGHHSMGAESGVDWGHSACPGTAIKAQKPAILARAIAIVNGDDDMIDMGQEVPDCGGLTVGEWMRDMWTWKAVDRGLSPADADGAPLPHDDDRFKGKATFMAALWRRVAPVPPVDVAALAAALAGQLPHVTEQQVLDALQSDAGQAALVAAANKAEDS